VTGGNTGIGFATAMELARRGGRVHLACRSQAKGASAAAAIVAATGNAGVSFLRLDLADLSSVRACADAFLAAGEPLHVLINNAGVAGQRGLTSDGFELAFGVNHLGHFALTSALLDRLIDSAPARVVTVSSGAHFEADGIDFAAVRRRGRTLRGMRAYAVSKLCNVLFTQELARRLDGQGVVTSALHPGVVASDIWRRIPWPIRPLVTARMLSTTDGARTSVFCATSAEVAEHSGRYYDDCKESAPSEVATAELGKILWERSEAWTGS
jgi:NAD(P)-dependent dehydrogenase (short-subunit alcohol dehydrogenase family)